MAVVAGDKIVATEFRAKLVTWLNNNLPTGGYESSTSSLPWGVWSTYLTTKANTVNIVMGLYDTAMSDYIKSGVKIYGSNVFSVLQTMFGYLKGHVRAIRWDDLGSSSPGSQATPADRANAYTAAGTTGGTWTYFAQSFSWNSSGLNTKPAAVNNSKKKCKWYKLVS